MNRIIEYYNLATKIYHKNIFEKEGYLYLINRGISGKVIKDMRIGYNNGTPILPRACPEWILKCSKLFRRNREIFSNAVIFPCIVGNDTLYFSSRKLKGYWEKYYDSPHFHLPGPINYVYNYNIISQTDTVFLVEGCIDTLTLLTHNRPAIGLLGALRMTEKIARSMTGKRVYILMDNDVNGSGQKASIRNASILHFYGINSSIIFLPDKGYSYDINDFLMKYPVSALDYLIKYAVPYSKTESFRSKKYAPPKKHITTEGDMEIVVQYYHFKTRRNGRGYKINCPLPSHKDDTASMQIYLDTNSYYCFGCGRVGTPLSLISEIEMCSKDKAMEIYSQLSNKETVKLI